MLIAAASALASSLGFLLMVQRLPTSQPLLVPLVGLIYGGLIGAAVTFVAYQADLLQYIDIWMNGEFSGVLRGRYELLWIAALGAAASYLIADQFAIVGMGRTTSISLGLNYRQAQHHGLVEFFMTYYIDAYDWVMVPNVYGMSQFADGGGFTTKPYICGSNYH